MLMYLHYYPTNIEPNKSALLTMLMYLLFYPTHSEPSQRCLYRLYRQCHNANKGYHANVPTYTTTLNTVNQISAAYIAFSGSGTALTKATMLVYLLYYPTHSEPNQRCLYRLFRHCHSANKGYHANVPTLLPYTQWNIILLGGLFLDKKLYI